MRWLLLLFVIVPTVELLLLIEIGRVIGTGPTIALIVFTGILGASLARWQGLGILRRIQEETAAGRVPAEPLVDGVLVLLAGAVLMTPGVLTDLLGFLCLLPLFRRWLKTRLRRRFERTIRTRFSSAASSRDPLDSPYVRDVTPPKSRPPG